MIISFINRSDEIYKDKLFSSNKWKTWFNSATSNFNIKKINIFKINMFGDKIGFVHFEVIGFDKEGNPFPGIVFLRGDSVSIFTVINNKDNGEKFVLLVDQSRIPSAKNILESPAGMVDEGNPSSIAIQELKEEVGSDIDFSQSNLFKLESGFSSPGGSDEFITIYSYELFLSSSDIEKLNGRITGNKNENEFIKIKIVPFDKVFSISESIITKFAAYAYQNIKK
jgi:8-oxo-dGTP pyrophosphatase MutT (NUDIX family)